MERKDASLDSGPVAVGGIGGSGTRVVADILRGIGFWMGPLLNRSLDNLWFTILLKRAELLLPENAAESREMVDLFLDSMSRGGPLTEREKATALKLCATDRPFHRASSLSAWAHRVFERLEEESRPPGRPWAWKEGNTLHFLDRLCERRRDLRYIHIQRNGRSMALSGNRQQAKTWGEIYCGAVPAEISPRFALRYWCEITRRVEATSQRLGGRMMVVQYEDLCSRPHDSIAAIASFLGAKLSTRKRDDLASLVSVPPTISRGLNAPDCLFDKGDLRFAKAREVEFVA